MIGYRHTKSSWPRSCRNGAINIWRRASMWIFTVKGFYSAVADAQKPGQVLVRARCKADIWNLYRGYHHRFTMTRPKADERRDYRWRLGMKRKDFARLAAALAHEV